MTHEGVRLGLTLPPLPKPRVLAALLLVIGCAPAGAATPALTPAPALTLTPAPEAPSPAPPSPARRDYLLACGGCHGLQGASNSRAVPQLKDLVGFYLSTAEGRRYLPRLPNVAFAPLSNDALAAVLNYVVFDFGGASVPAGAPPYEAAEVARWRAQPLNDVPLTQYRRRLVASLIKSAHAPARLGDYETVPRSATGSSFSAPRSP